VKEEGAMHYPSRKHVGEMVNVDRPVRR